MIRRRLAALVLAVLLPACGGGGGGGVAPSGSSTPPATPSTGPVPVVADITVLMMGNSHTTTNGLPNMLAAMLRAGRPGKTVAVVAAQESAFLDEQLRSPSTRQLFSSQAWSAVVFQAQKYSTSGQFDYSTSEAVEWVRMARARQIVPVMFPEWSRRGVDETQYLYDLHVGIARQQAACVAPIPQAWDLGAIRAPNLPLHAADGNHSASAGSFLAALVLYAALTGNAPGDLPALAALGVSDNAQALLRVVADEQVRLVSPRRWCPDDVRL